MTGGKNDSSGFPMQPSHVMVGSSYAPPFISLADIALVKNEEPLVLPDIEGSSAIGPDQLFYPEDPLQTLLGTYLPPVPAPVPVPLMSFPLLVPAGVSSP